MKSSPLIILLTSFIRFVNAQNEAPIHFICEYKNEDSSIRISIENISPKKTYYYSVGIEGLTDTGWIGLTADINSLGTNDFWALIPITPGNRLIKYISKERILHIYASKKITQVRFEIEYFEKKDFNSKKQSITSSPM
jgi:hypothetical protein